MKRKLIKSYCAKVFHAAAGFAVLLVLWQALAAFGGFNKALFPPPETVFRGMLELWASGTLADGLFRSIYRFAAGYLSASLLGMIAGLYFGTFRRFWNFVNPVAQVLRPISPVAWLPFVVLWFGIGDIPAIVIVFIAAFFPVLLNTVSSVGKIDPAYIRIARNLGLNKTQTFIRIIFPAAFPYITSGLHIAIGTAWIFLVAGEMAGTQSGLGFLIIDARNNIRSDLLLAVMIVIGVTGLIIDSLVVCMEKYIYKKWGMIQE